jgi:hypothetical protein
VIWIILRKNKQFLKEETVLNKFGAAYENLRTSSNTALAYTSVFMMKRLAFVMIVFLI